ncbi:PASTA domain-containing protein [Kribbella rubisoli]|uniref:PASTA domain-containing protein n=1 Tax=Kribbella rubisoli TaxID=3075929 RepID=A0A4Q7X8J7_9ACTN|nr:PASTA domain-containing protein [Kribbella rubisoli]RZU19394.1 PASTA domain-containing protein [Kribbella rubisoli]
MKLTDLLERTAEQTPVGPPPLDTLYAGAARRRHRRTAGVVAAAAVAVGSVIGASTLLTSRTPTAPVTSPTPVPPAMRLVGFGHAAIAIPADWPTNRSQCGTPMQDTVQIDDPSARLYCMAFRPAGVESVGLYYGSPRAEFRADETFEIGGVRAERQRTTCSTSNYPKANRNTTTCGGTVSIPSLKVWFRAESSTSAADVDRMLSRIQIVPGRSGVLSPWTVTGPPTGPLVGNYTPLLAAAGLKAQYKRVKSPSYPTGTIISISPAAGTMLPVGSTVTVTIAR